MKTTNVKLRLQRDNAPTWALGEQEHSYWYFENEHGEQWVAKREADQLYISGLDIDWEQYRLTLEEANEELERINGILAAKFLSKIPELGELDKKNLMEAIVVRQRQFTKLPLARLILDTCELLWVAAVLEAAIPGMEWARKQAQKS
ncbi:hypothetical protein [Paenibacillus sp. MMS20-IR301]|uniref:hypothetical protein n=1 Tax=Paenibacillus sp. MMS20-IR301 TaxID=2895946 RepID=UPI0028EEB7DD|nr:hypothetical protein [Paenibacillus sp. MMS20-IR301]WNS42071.1 hypothetical protein LOS79_24120 [Paenibacillus sp. MMS20-IR301]